LNENKSYSGIEMGQASILQKSQNMKIQNKDGIMNEDGLADSDLVEQKPLNVTRLFDSNFEFNQEIITKNENIISKFRSIGFKIGQIENNIFDKIKVNLNIKILK
jgi:hypothetical protein